MKKKLLISLIFSGIFCHTISQGIKLTAIYDSNNPGVKLTWNMVNSSTRTSYLLLRSGDGVTWTEAAKDRMLRNYTDDDIYFFNDKFYLPGKNFYRLKISDGYNNTIALSTIVIVNTRDIAKSSATYPTNTQKQIITKDNNTTPQINSPSKSNNSWIIYPNPATDFLKLTYNGSGELKGVVNVQIQDANGKTVTKFRSGSMYKSIQIPISNLQRGTYFIQVTVMNELMMSQKFIKQ